MRPVLHTGGEDSIHTWWLKKVSHYTNSSLNRIKTPRSGYVFHSSEYKRSTRILQVGIKYCMHDIICDFIKYDKIVIENLKKRTYGNQRNLLATVS